MSKILKCSPPDKRVGKKKVECPSFTHHENDLWHGLCDATVAKYNRVETVHSPFRVSELFRGNYDSIFRKV
jgi:hypothetical protein